MALDQVSFNTVLKTLYPEGVPLSLTIKDNPFWALIDKTQDFYGKNLQLPFRFADPQARSRTFSTALAGRATANSKYRAAILTRGHEYASLQIDRETILASQNDAGAFLQARKAEVDGMLNELGRAIGISLFADGSGIRGQISSTSNVGTPTITLAEPNDVTNFEVGQPLVATSARPAAGTPATLRSSGAVAYIVGVDRDAGTITVSATDQGAAANWSTCIAAVAAGDFLLVNGDNVGFSSTATNSAIVGLGGWLPLVAPTVGGGDSFFGMDRSADASRLAGIRYTGTGLPIEEALMRCAARVARDGGRPDTVILNYNQWANIGTSLTSKVRYEKVMVGDIGFSSYTLAGPKGDLRVMADQNCPNGNFYMLQMDTWKFHHLEAAPHIIALGNVNGALQEAAADAIQIRASVLGQVMCTAPGYNAVGTLDV